MRSLCVRYCLGRCLGHRFSEVRLKSWKFSRLDVWDLDKNEPCEILEGSEFCKFLTVLALCIEVDLHRGFDSRTGSSSTEAHRITWLSFSSWPLRYSSSFVTTAELWICFETLKGVSYIVHEFHNAFVVVMYELLTSRYLLWPTNVNFLHNLQGF